jgi:hypothetical protein
MEKIFVKPGVNVGCEFSSNLKGDNTQQELMYEEFKGFRRLYIIIRITGFFNSVQHPKF